MEEDEGYHFSKERGALTGQTSRETTITGVPSVVEWKWWNRILLRRRKNVWK